MKHYIIRDIVLSDLGTDLLPESKIVKDLFDGIFSELIEDTYKNGIKWSKNDIIYFQQDDKNGHTWVNYKHIWSVLESKLGYNYNQIKELTQDGLEHYLKRKVLPTIFNHFWRCAWLEHYLKRKVLPTSTDNYIPKDELEHHLKRKVLPTVKHRFTYNRKLEHHLKRKVLPTIAAIFNFSNSLEHHLKRKVLPTVWCLVKN